MSFKHAASDIGRAALVGLAVLLVAAAPLLLAAPALAGKAGKTVAYPPEKTSQTIAGAPVYQRTFDSPLYTIDGIYRSMKGPQSTGLVRLGRPGEHELVWITGHNTTIIGDGASSPEFMCHSNLTFHKPEKHRELFNSQSRARLFTLSQGAMEVRFPEGFGIPVMTDEPFKLATQVLNLNEQPETLEVRHRATIEFVRQADLKEPIKPLIVLSAQGMVALDEQERYFGKDDASAAEHGPGCSVGHTAGTRTIVDPAGRQFAAHWVVPPGRDENRTLVTQWMNIPYDSTVHFISVHLHPFAESVELVDLTTKQVLFRSHTQNAEARIGLNRVESFASAEGIPIYRDHEYELKSIYNNTTDEDQDSMAVMFLYTLDKTFELRGDLASNPTRP